MQQADAIPQIHHLIEDSHQPVEPPVRKPPRPIAERRFYTGMGIAFIIIVLIGFGPTFYLKPLNLIQYPRPAPELTLGVMIHGITFGLWVLLFLAQTTLVAAGRRNLHRRLGMASMIFAVALIPIMYLNSVWQVARANGPPFTDPLTWTAVPLISIPFFIAVGWLAWSARRSDLASHKRLMLGLMIMVMEPAVGRFPIAPPTLAGHISLSILGWLLFVPLFLWDWRSLGRIHRATLLGAALYAASLSIQVAFLAFPGPWAQFAAHLPGIGS